MEKAKAIRVSEETHSELMHLKGLIEAKERREVSVDDVIREVLRRYRPA